MVAGVSLVVPTRNAGAELREILPAMLDQDLPVPLEVLVIDSGSTDGTVELVRRSPARLLEIPPDEFDHGLTRALGVREAGGEVVCFATQDARPFDRLWLRSLVECFDDPVVAGAYSCQLPRPDANPLIRERLKRWAAGAAERRVQRLADPAELERLQPLERLERVAFDNVSSAVRRSVALRIPFRQCRFGEDLDWAFRVIRAGHAIVFEPRSKVVHSHNRSMWYEFKRVFLDHAHLHDLLGVHTVPTFRSAAACTVSAFHDLRGVVERDERLGRGARAAWKARCLPYAATQNLAQYLGAATARGRRGRTLRGRLFRGLHALLAQGV